MQYQRYRFMVVILAILVGFLGAFMSYRMMSRQKPSFHGTVLEHPRLVRAFSLMDTHDQIFDQKRLQGHWTILFFGFTQCTMVCPVTMAQLAQVARLLEQDGKGALPQVVMVTLDPEQDDLSQLGRYVSAFHPTFLGARGELPSIQGLTHDMGVAYARIQPDPKQSHQDMIQHTGALMLINPKGELTAFFTPPHHAEDIANDYRLIQTL